MTQIIQSVDVSGYNLSPNVILAGTRGSFGLTKLRLNLSPEWQKASVRVIFHPQRGAPIEVAYKGEAIDIPYAIMENSGKAGFVVSGIMFDESEGDGKKTITLPGEIEVLYTLEDKGVESAGFNPSAYEQVLGLIGNLGDLATLRRENIVAAINYLVLNGGIGSGSGSGGGGSGGVAFIPGNALELTPEGKLNVVTTDSAEKDNTLPITSAAVATTVGNIEVLLGTI
jgi:hypothetical protein